MKKESLGADVAKHVKEMAEKIENSKSTDKNDADKAGFIRETFGLLGFLVGKYTKMKVKEDFFEKLNDCFPDKESFKLENIFSEASKVLSEKAIWRVSFDKGKIASIEKEGDISSFSISTRDFSTKASIVKEDRKEIKIKNRIRKSEFPCYKRGDILSFFREKLEEYNLWFTQLPYSAKNELMEELAKKISSGEKSNLTEKNIIHILPRIWRGGLDPQRGLDGKELIIFAIKEASKTGKWSEVIHKTLSEIDTFLQKIDLKYRILYRDHLPSDLSVENQLTLGKRLIMELEKIKKEEKTDDLGAIVVSYLSDSLVAIGLHEKGKKIKEEVEKELAPRLAKRLFENLFEINEKAAEEALESNNKNGQ